MNIGFARSQIEIDVVELQPDYPRAHLTRYGALYTSLSTSYELQFDDAHALVEPFALGGVSRLRQEPRTLTLHRNSDVRLTDFDLSSNSTAMLHSEQMIDFGGSITCSSESGQLRIYNHSSHALEQSGVVWRTPEGEFQAAWVGQLPTGSDRPLEFHTVPNRSPALPQFQNPLSTKPDEAPAVDSTDIVKSSVPGTEHQIVKVENAANPTLLLDGSIHGILTSPMGYANGDMRLIGLLAEPLKGMNVSPQASQATRANVFVVANLRYVSEPRRRLTSICRRKKLAARTTRRDVRHAVGCKQMIATSGLRNIR